MLWNVTDTEDLSHKSPPKHSSRLLLLLLLIHRRQPGLAGKTITMTVQTKYVRILVLPYFCFLATRGTGWTDRGACIRETRGK